MSSSDRGERTVFVLTHEYELWGRDDAKMIGVYASRDDAEAALARARVLPGFRDWPEGLRIDEYEVGRDHWGEGFSRIVTVHVAIVGSDPVRWRAVGAEWMPGDRFRLFAERGDRDEKTWAFRPGQVVRCEERTIDGVPGCLCAIRAAE